MNGLNSSNIRVLGNFKCGSKHSQIIHSFAIADSTLKVYEIIVLI